MKHFHIFDKFKNRSTVRVVHFRRERVEELIYSEHEFLLSTLFQSQIMWSVPENKSRSPGFLNPESRIQINGLMNSWDFTSFARATKISSREGILEGRFYKWKGSKRHKKNVEIVFFRKALKSYWMVCTPLSVGEIYFINK